MAGTRNVERSKWTPERIERLKKLWAEGCSGTECAVKLGGGISRSAVIAKVYRLGLPQRQTKGRYSYNSRTNVKRPRNNREKVSAGGWQKTAAPTFNPDQALVKLQERQAADEIGVKSFVDLQDNQCRWPIGDPKSDDFGFCGLERIPGRSYCEGHCARAYESPAVRKRKTHHGEGGGFRFENDNSRKPEKEVETVDT